MADKNHAERWVERLDQNQKSAALCVPSSWEDQAEYYQQYLDELDEIYTIVEIGVGYGYSLFTMARDYPESLVIGIENFSLNEDHSMPRTRRKHLSKFIPLYENIRLLEGDSVTIGEGWRKSDMYVDIDVLHIDADHHYHSVKADFNAWVPHVRPGGVVMFHDIQTFPDDVGKFFSEISTSSSVVHGNLGVWRND